ncbi:hypothetical protein SK128_002868 [Halocaridina rubra]|uniref:C2H2-type domain-containing protein n=1 Tax=Halocaridina rubra TaxID=373956 RepID=A0AAN8WMX8_HALRR
MGSRRKQQANKREDGKRQRKSKRLQLKQQISKIEDGKRQRKSKRLQLKQQINKREDGKRQRKRSLEQRISIESPLSQLKISRARKISENKYPADQNSVYRNTYISENNSESKVLHLPQEEDSGRIPYNKNAIVQNSVYRNADSCEKNLENEFLGFQTQDLRQPSIYQQSAGYPDHALDSRADSTVAGCHTSELLFKSSWINEFDRSNTEIEESNCRGCQVPFYEDTHFNHPFSGRVYFDFNSQENVEQSTVSQVVLSPEYHLFSQQSSDIADNLPQVEHLPDINQSSLDSQLQHREYALHNPMNLPFVMVESDVGMADGGLGNILSVTSTILDPPDPGAEVCSLPSFVYERGQSLPHQEIHVHPTYAHHWMCESSYLPSMNRLQIDNGILRPGSRTLHETRLREYQETPSQQQSNEHHISSLQPLCVKGLGSSSVMLSQNDDSFRQVTSGACQGDVPDTISERELLTSYDQSSPDTQARLNEVTQQNQMHLSSSIGLKSGKMENGRLGSSYISRIFQAPINPTPIVSIQPPGLDPKKQTPQHYGFRLPPTYTQHRPCESTYHASINHSQVPRGERRRERLFLKNTRFEEYKRKSSFQQSFGPHLSAPKTLCSTVQERVSKPQGFLSTLISQNDGSCQSIPNAPQTHFPPATTAIPKNSDFHDLPSESTSHKSGSHKLSASLAGKGSSIRKGDKHGTVGIVPEKFPSRKISMNNYTSQRQLSSGVVKDGFVKPPSHMNRYIIHPVARVPRPPTVDLTKGSTSRSPQGTQDNFDQPQKPLFRLLYKCSLCTHVFYSQKGCQEHYNDCHLSHLNASDLAIPLLDLRNPNHKKLVASLRRCLSIPSMRTGDSGDVLLEEAYASYSNSIASLYDGGVGVCGGYVCPVLECLLLTPPHLIQARFNNFYRLCIHFCAGKSSFSC